MIINQCRICSDDTATLHAIEPLRPTGDMDEAWQTLRRYLAEQTNVTIVSEQPNYLATEFRTRIMRFVDDVEFEARHDDGVIAMRSASRIGFSDLGANRHRLEQLRSALATAGVIHPRGSADKASKP